MQCKDVTPIIAELVRLKNSIPLEIDVGRYLPEVRKNTHGEAVRSGLKKALRVIEQAPVVDAMPRWISVEERLPEHDVFVLVGYNRYDLVFEGCYLEDEKNWCDREYSYIAPPSHWMPLPEPPKEK